MSRSAMVSAAARPTMTAAGAREAHELIQQMAQGQRAGLEGLYDRYGQLVFNVAVRILQNPTDAEEVVQEVFLQAWRDARRYDEARGTPWAWLVMLARARAIDAVRSIGRFQRWVAPGVASDIPDPDPPGAELLAQRQLVTGALQHLSAAQRELLELAYYQGLTQSEIAARTGVPLGTVKTRIRTALERLRDALVPKAPTAP
jgi:RNA polymerase sigma-70 factor (ECF subfamily)